MIILCADFLFKREKNQLSVVNILSTNSSFNFIFINSSLLGIILLQLLNLEISLIICLSSSDFNSVNFSKKK